ncbi:MAG: hypothetical protein KBT57_03195 [bacterium]|nr:hypothetical protein [Candidatus Limimorpha equi]
MTKKKEYRYDRIELCRNCHGIGRMMGQTMCPVCDGKGLIKKAVEIAICIEPYDVENS